MARSDGGAAAAPLYEQALALARSAGARPAEIPSLSCQLLLGVLPTGLTVTGDDPWYKALAFRALQASGQVLEVSDRHEQHMVEEALRLRVRMMRYLLACGQLDDVVAAADLVLSRAGRGGTAPWAASVRAAAALSADALHGLGDDRAAAERRARAARI